MLINLILKIFPRRESNWIILTRKWLLYNREMMMRRLQSLIIKMKLIKNCKFDFYFFKFNKFLNHHKNWSFYLKIMSTEISSLSQFEQWLSKLFNNLFTTPLELTLLILAIYKLLNNSLLTLDLLHGLRPFHNRTSHPDFFILMR